MKLYIIYLPRYNEKFLYFIVEKIMRFYGIDYMIYYIQTLVKCEMNPETTMPIVKGSNTYKRCKLLAIKFEKYLTICCDEKKWEEYLKTRDGILELLIFCCFIDREKLLDIVRLGKYHYSRDKLKLRARLPSYYLKKTSEGIICVAKDKRS